LGKKKQMGAELEAENLGTGGGRRDVTVRNTSFPFRVCPKGTTKKGESIETGERTGNKASGGKIRVNARAFLCGSVRRQTGFKNTGDRKLIGKTRKN